MINKAPDFHTPVLGPDVSRWLITDPSGVYVDATVGGGGHAEIMLEELGDAGRWIGIDRDPEAVEAASRRLKRFGGRARVVQGCFWDLKAILATQGVSGVSGVLFDLGVSSHQIDASERGFSFSQDGPLDMRMGPDAARSAQDVVNSESLEHLIRIFRTYGEERASVRIARAICRAREEKPLRRTLELANLVARQVRGRMVQKTLARIFQAIRIEVNGELEPLQDALQGAVEVLKPGGRIGVLSYHSLEDRVVKQVFRDASQECIGPTDFPICACERVAMARVLTRVRAGASEVNENPRARSATLRVAERLEGGVQRWVCEALLNS
ncbi:MAG: 16S rRNA (cytosine(1402)-N(4))-methyltransferase RsmH [bacterium]|nr:16S rRNA (cytosine(1402)-N(4))-methyltransferase RsmH [bacterium]